MWMELVPSLLFLLSSPINPSQYHTSRGRWWSATASTRRPSAPLIKAEAPFYPVAEMKSRRTKRRRRPRLPVLQYHKDWVCINKPAGMTIHRSHRQKKSEAVVTTSLKRQLSRKVFPVHRLDHRTSGALVFAFNSDAAALLQTALSEARKTYVALLRGDWEEMYPGQTSITVGIPLSVHGIAKDATSIFTRLAVGCAAGIDDPKGAGRQATRKCTLVSVQPVTGRTHQIRRHARHLGMTVLGDTQHGDSVVNRWWRTCRDPPLGRLALHCLALDFVLPARQEKIAIVAPLPRELLCVFQSDDVRDMWNEAVAQEPRLAAKWIDIRGGTLGIRKDWQIEIDKKMKNRAHERKTAP